MTGGKTMTPFVFVQQQNVKSWTGRPNVRDRDQLARVRNVERLKWKSNC
jgi:hypothetical protein